MFFCQNRWSSTAERKGWKQVNSGCILFRKNGEDLLIMIFVDFLHLWVVFSLFFVVLLLSNMFASITQTTCSQEGSFLAYLGILTHTLTSLLFFKNEEILQKIIKIYQFSLLLIDFLHLPNAVFELIFRVWQNRSGCQP